MISDIEKFRLQNIRDSLFTYIKFLMKLLKNQTKLLIQLRIFLSTDH